MGVKSNGHVVREYVVYDNRVRDRRTGQVVKDVAGFFAGKIDDLMRGVIRYRAAKRQPNHDDAS